jgi:hypothetical protein
MPISTSVMKCIRNGISLTSERRQRVIILAPFLLNFDHSSAKTLSIVVGVVIMLSGMRRGAR